MTRHGLNNLPGRVWQDRTFHLSKPFEPLEQKRYGAYNSFEYGLEDRALAPFIPQRLSHGRTAGWVE